MWGFVCVCVCVCVCVLKGCVYVAGWFVHLLLPIHQSWSLTYTHPHPHTHSLGAIEVEASDGLWRPIAETRLSKRIIACLDVRSNDEGDLVVTKGDQYDVREAGEGEGEEDGYVCVCVCVCVCVSECT